MNEPVEFSHVNVWKHDDTWFAEVVCVDGDRIEIDIEPAWETVHFFHDDISVKHFAHFAGDYRINHYIIADTRAEVAEKIRHHDYWEALRYG